jgi:hypothetical protein
MVWLGQPMFDAVLAANLVETVHPIARRPTVAVARQVGELDAVVGENRMQAIRRRRDQRFEEGDGRWAIGLLMQLHEGELRGSVDADEQVELAFLGPDFGDVDVKEADRVGLELLLRGLVAFNLREPADAVSLQAAMQGRARQMENGGLQGVETIVERQ